ncbi:tetratricopeptide repeat protein [Cupriavidus sp. UME77]|uniref:tetratricopeptide repeat protein n=1 Tax=Cupriavidus sp. UME77 TaxID=1862321 RepID=UPI001603A738|nr:tetratricopeptide repeat protein [Cupriavidus sp. UME77]MBB1634119.1 hypothetical protein [Cupriavidus sp. UME77]
MSMAAGSAWAGEAEDLYAAMEAGKCKPAATTLQARAKAGAQGDADARNQIGMMYLHGEGVPKDPAEAVRWFRLAAEQGDADAQVYLGSALFNGEGMLLSNKREGVKWFRKAAVQGNEFGQLDLAIAHEHGLGVPRNRVLAYAWVLLSTRGVKPDAEGVKLRTEIEKDLTAKQRAEAERLAREWKVGQDLTTTMQ